MVGLRGIRVMPESKERDRLSFAFMSNGISSERQVETAVRQTAALVRQRDGAEAEGAGGGRARWWCIRAASAGLAALIRGGWVQALLSGNALGVHDIEAALFGTSLGVRLADGRQEEHGHRNHMRAINAIYHAGGVAAGGGERPAHAGILYECVKADVPFVLAGSLRDDGPLPDTITDMNAAQDAYARAVASGAGLVICLGSMLHSIATGNMLPSWVKIVCVDINPGGRHQGERPRHRAGGGRGGRRRPVPRPAFQGSGMKRAYTDEHAAAGVDAELPEIETWPNQYPGLRDRDRRLPEFTSVCPKTGLPGFRRARAALRAGQALPGTEVATRCTCWRTATWASSRRTW